MIASPFDAFLFFFFELDGVVYLGEGSLPGAVQALAGLRAAGKVVHLRTNEPRPSRRQGSSSGCAFRSTACRRWPG